MLANFKSGPGVPKLHGRLQISKVWRFSERLKARRSGGRGGLSRWDDLLDSTNQAERKTNNPHICLRGCWCAAARGNILRLRIAGNAWRLFVRCVSFSIFKEPSLLLRGVTQEEEVTKFVVGGARSAWHARNFWHPLGFLKNKSLTHLNYFHVKFKKVLFQKQKKNLTF